MKTFSGTTRALCCALGLAAFAPAAHADSWRFFSATDLRRHAIEMTTDPKAATGAPISLCAPQARFACMRAEGAFSLAIPKVDSLPLKWQFENVNYKVMEKSYSITLFGSTAEGVLVQGIDKDKLESYFLYSPLRGFMAFQWTDSPKKRPVLFLIADKCGPGAAPECK